MAKRNLFWSFMYKVFKIRRPIPKDLLDFDEIYSVSDVICNKNHTHSKRCLQ